MITIKPHSKILFQGDSITDASRDYANGEDLGRGYPNFVASWYSALHPEQGVEFVNRGLSGNRAIDLVNRWDADCLEIKPDILTILIGINDTWRKFDRNDPTSVEDFEVRYRNILQRTKEALPDTAIILMEPFVLPEPPDRLEWREDLNPKILVTRKLAEEYQLTLIPLDYLFQKACALRSPLFWSLDGVHPTQAGHALIAQSILKITGETF
jgi:lysophospholipase L1-like esterase